MSFSVTAQREMTGSKINLPYRIEIYASSIIDFNMLVTMGSAERSQSDFADFGEEYIKKSGCRGESLIPI
jgi:hypothetical protein